MKVIRKDLQSQFCISLLFTALYNSSREFWGMARIISKGMDKIVAFPSSFYTYFL